MTAKNTADERRDWRNEVVIQTIMMADKLGHGDVALEVAEREGYPVEEMAEELDSLP